MLILNQDDEKKIEKKETEFNLKKSIIMALKKISLEEVRAIVDQILENELEK